MDNTFDTTPCSEPMAPGLIPPQPQPQTTTSPRPLPSPPFIPIDGLYNFRDCGGYPIAGQPGKIVRPGVLYRSGEPSRITPAGIAQLQALGVSRVFDLRSASEIEASTRQGWGQVRVWEGATRIEAAVFTEEEIAEGKQKRGHGLLKHGGVEGFTTYYATLLTSASSPLNPCAPLKTILSHLATVDPPNPIMIHCSLGKDRTGVVCAIILSLLGVADDVVAEEYALTGVGIADAEKVGRIIEEIRPRGEGITEEERRFFGARAEAMKGFLEGVRSKGGVERCVVEGGLLSGEEVERLRGNMVVEMPPN